MTLIDSLLLDPYPFEVWIAYRTDGVKGTGTLNDPFDGSTKLDTARSVTALSNTGQEATATSTAHPYGNGDVVRITGVTGAGANRFNGTFIIYGVATNSFKYYMTGVPAAASAGSITSAKVLGYRFDDVMNTLPEKARVHLGPTPAGYPFLTRGYADGVSGGWQPKAGMKISGSGTDAITLQLVGAPTADAHSYAIGHALSTGNPAQPNLLDFIEVSDLSIDCNAVIPSATAAACGGIRVLGNHVRIFRVKAINWGTNATTVPCFALSVLTGDRTLGLTEVTDCGIESCIVTQPATSPANSPVTALHAGGKEAISSNAEAFGKAPFIRNCFVDCGWTTTTMESRGLSMSWCRAGVVEGNQVHNTKYGGPYSEKTTTRDLVVRNNFYKNVAKGPYWNLGQSGPSSLGTGSLARSGTVGTVTVTSHGLAAGDRVKLATSQSSLDGVYRVVSVNGNDFVITMADSGPTSATVNSAYRVFSTDKMIVEGNIIELASGSNGAVAIHVHDNASSALTPDYAHGDVIVRNNKVRYLDGSFDAANAGYAMHANGAKNLLTQDSVVECAPANPLRNQRCGAVSYFNNMTPGGFLVRGLNLDTNQKYDELETEAEDAFILGLLKGS